MWQRYFRQYLQTQFPLFLEKQPWNYKDDLCVTGAFDLARASRNSLWIDLVLPYTRYLLTEDGIIRNWIPGEHNIDKISFAKSLRCYGNVTKDSRYSLALQECRHNLLDYPRTVTGNFWHKDIYPHQVWLDGLYMGLPVYASFLDESGEDRWDDIFDQFESAHRLLWNPTLGLYMHANDCSRKMEWASPETGQSPSVWLRAEGWFLMALCDVYEIAEKHSSRSKELIPLLQNALLGLLPYRQKDTGMFLQVVNRSDLSGNYSETSGSAMVAYAFMKGSRLGMLPTSAYALGASILEGIHCTYLQEETDGIHLYGICASAGLGPGPDHRSDRTGTPEYYLSEKQMTDNQHGAAACMMAYSETLYHSGT